VSDGSLIATFARPRVMIPMPFNGSGKDRTRRDRNIRLRNGG
jgi:hypothetical protein